MYCLLVGQVIGPHEMSANTGVLLGRAKAEARLLAAHGWQAIHVPVGSTKDQSRLITKQLSKCGLDVRLLPRKQGGQQAGRSSGMQRGTAAARQWGLHGNGGNGGNGGESSFSFQAAPAAAALGHHQGRQRTARCQPPGTGQSAGVPRPHPAHLHDAFRGSFR